MLKPSLFELIDIICKTTSSDRDPQSTIQGPLRLARDTYSVSVPRKPIVTTIDEHWIILMLLGYQINTVFCVLLNLRMGVALAFDEGGHSTGSSMKSPNCHDESGNANFFTAAVVSVVAIPLVLIPLIALFYIYRRQLMEFFGYKAYVRLDDDANSSSGISEWWHKLRSHVPLLNGNIPGHDFGAYDRLDNEERSRTLEERDSAEEGSDVSDD